MDLGLADRVFLVTGGSRGLGLAAAQALVLEGASVVVAARDPQSLAASVATLGGGSTAVGIAADLADPNTAERLVAGTVARFGRLDGLLVSGGGPPPGGALQLGDEVWRAAFESVLLGAVRMARAAASALGSQPGDLSGCGGAMLFVLSTSVRSAISGLGLSNALRPGLAMVVKELADELGPRGVRVNGVMPGRFATDRMFALDARIGSPEAVRRRNENLIPLGRYGQPDEFGRLAAFLLSPAASYITGTVSAIDGGSLRTI